MAFFNKIDQFFGFTNSQWKGVRFVSIVSAIFFFLMWWFPKVHYDEKLEYILNAQQHEELEKVDQIVALNEFNPNRVLRSDLVAMGVHENVRATWLKYLSKGGRFYQKTDVLKLYGLSKEEFLRLEPYIVFEEVEVVDKDSLESETPNVKWDINKVEVKHLVSLRLTDTKISERILRFRDALGGFYELNQLHEVYGLKPLVAGKLEKHLYVGVKVKPWLDVHNASFKEVLAHPYLDYEDVKLLFKLRDQNHLNKENLKEAWGASLYYKIYPYLDFSKVKPAI